MGSEFEIKLKSFIFLICKIFNKNVKIYNMSKLKFGALTRRKDERIYKNFHVIKYLINIEIKVCI